jgi:hypothetical protein
MTRFWVKSVEMVITSPKSVSIEFTAKGIGGKIQPRYCENTHVSPARTIGMQTRGAVLMTTSPIYGIFEEV